jgi:predicted nucleic acid-binding protein
MAAVHSRLTAQGQISVPARIRHKDSDAVAAAVAHFRRRPAMGFSDCLPLEVARKAGHLPLGTFDRDLAKLDGVERL